MANLDLPGLTELLVTIRGIVNKDVKLKALTAKDVPNFTGRFVGFYDDGAAKVLAAWVSDASLTAALGAALTLIPPGAVKDAVKSGKLSSDLLDNSREVVNIVANTFVGKRVRLVSFGPNDSAQAAALDTLVKSGGHRVDYSVEVAGYPAGVLTLVALSG